MPLPDRLHRLRDDLDPASETRSRVRARVLARVDAPAALLRDARAALEPEDAVCARVWSRITPALAGGTSKDLLDRVRGLLSPDAALSHVVWRRMRPSLAPVASATPRGGRIIKWTAAFALFALAVRVSPLLFLASPSIADSQVSFLPTRGEVAISIGGFWQPVLDEIPLESGVMLRTHKGEASILFHDDGVIRLGPETTVTLHDTSDRRENAPEVMPVLTLHTGSIWVQGLIPAHVRGLTVATKHGHITVHEGSVSVAEERDGIHVDVYNRRAVVLRGGRQTTLVRGERTQLWDGNILRVHTLDADALDRPWVVQNLARDAVHRREIAQLQQERRAARAGILPTSRLYPVKRVAERVDVLLTYGEQARMEKQIEHASVRLAEATALLQEGKMEEVAQPLQDYRDAITSMATGSGAGSVAQFLLQQAVSETAADMSASLPGDHAYVIKRAVLEASAALPDGLLSNEEVQAEILVDTLAVVTDAAEQGELTDLADVLPSVQEAVALLNEEDAAITPEIRRETEDALTRIALVLADKDPTEEEDALRDAVATFLPPEPVPVVVALTEEEVQAIVQNVWDRVYLYKMPQSRMNQMTVELDALKQHREAGHILRVLYQKIPGGSELNTLVRSALLDLRRSNAAEIDNG